MQYIGHLSRGDDFHAFLARDILPLLGHSGADPEFRVFRLPGSNHVYLYEERRTGLRVIGKFFGRGGTRPRDVACRRMAREHGNLEHARSLGFAGFPHYVVRPLGANGDTDCALVVEHCHGKTLSQVILEAIREGSRGPLFEKLSNLAAFLAALHNRTADGRGVDFHRECGYFEYVAGQLLAWGLLGQGDFDRLRGKMNAWRERPDAWEDQQVLVHGDATPANFLFGDAPWVIVLDLERMRRSDRVFDVGRVAGELKYFFLQYAGDPEKAEPFIGHFLWEYAGHFPDQGGAFASICRRVPFYLGLTLLRIARNHWIDGRHRRALLAQAERTLS